MRHLQTLSIAAASLAIVLGGCSGGTGDTGQAGNSTTANDATAPGENATTSAENATADTGLPEGEAIQVMLEKVATIPDKPNDQVALSNVKFVTGIAGNFITADARYGGGCRKHEFKAFWDGSWSKSNPPEMTIALRHNANGDTCMALLNRMVQINIGELTKLQKDFFVTLSGAGGDAGRVHVTIP
jgi:hypothetical protein